MLESLRIIIDETLEIYMLATLDGRLFIPFFIALIYIFATGKKEDDLARRYLVYPALVLLFFLFNPVFIHYIYKFIEVPERIVRMYWPLPMGMLFVYCIIRLVSDCRAVWKKAVILAAAALLLFLGSGGNISGVSYVRAENPQKLPKGTKEVSDIIYQLNDGGDPRVIMPTNLFFWIREYNPYIRLPYRVHVEVMERENEELDLDRIGDMALEGGCNFVVLNSSQSATGDITDYGFIEAARVEAQDFQYIIYQLK